jgi:hypothetical protein
VSTVRSIVVDTGATAAWAKGASSGELPDSVVVVAAVVVVVGATVVAEPDAPEHAAVSRPTATSRHASGRVARTLMQAVSPRHVMRR